MKLLTRHIAYLLRRHDCVIVDGVGAFVAHCQSAAFAADESFVSPTLRTVSFNSAITHTDGLLSASVAREQRISFEQASVLVADAVAKLHKHLSAEGAVEIPRVGTLTQRRGKLDFHPAKLVAGVWQLPRLALHTIEEQTVPTIEIKNEARIPQAVIRVPLLRRTWIRVAASVAVIVAVGLALTTPINIDQAYKASMDFTTPVEKPVKQDKVEPLDTYVELNIALPSEQAVEQMRPAPAAPHHYFVIVASLASRSLAEKYVAEFGGNILEKDGNFRIYMASGATQADAANAAAAISDFDSRFPGAWICRN